MPLENKNGRLVLCGDAGVLECTADNRIILYMTEDDEIALKSDGQFRAFSLYYLLATSQKFADLLDELIEEEEVWEKYVDFIKNGRDITLLENVDVQQDEKKPKFTVIQGGLCDVTNG